MPLLHHHRLLPRILLLSSPPSPSPLLLFRSKPTFSRFSTLASLPITAPEAPSPPPPPPAQDFRPASSDEDADQVHLPVDRLFLPPDAELPAAPNVPVRVLRGSNIVLGPSARGEGQVVSAEFIKSSVRAEDCPKDGLPEFALVGRSNVGKSSLLNSLVRRKKLALTSKTPGKTQCINHFKINDSWYLVDLPGFGYASAPKTLRTDWDEFTKNYFLKRESLVSVFLLIDASIPAKKIDLDYASWLGKNKVPMTLVFTKCDKRKKKKNGGKRPQENVEIFQELIREYFDGAPPWIMTSSVTNQGRDELLLHMSQLKNYWLKH